MKSVVVMGKGTLSIVIADWFRRSDDYKLRGVVPVTPEPEWTDSLTEWAEASDVRVISRAPRVVNMEPDLVFCVCYDQILCQKLIDACGLVLNLHNAPLPRYRGIRPINWALKNGETSHGVTIHEVTAEGNNSGPIYAQRMFPINPVVDEVRDVYGLCLQHGWDLFQNTMAMLWDIVPEPQNENHATCYSEDMADHLWERSGWTRYESVAECVQRQAELENDYADRLVEARDGKA